MSDVTNEEPTESVETAAVDSAEVETDDVAVFEHDQVLVLHLDPVEAAAVGSRALDRDRAAGEAALGEAIDVGDLTADEHLRSEHVGEIDERFGRGEQSRPDLHRAADGALDDGSRRGLRGQVVVGAER